MPTRSEIDDMTRDELYELATEADVAGRSTMSKDQLVDALATPLIGPADTHDPNVRVSSVRPATGEAIRAGQPTVAATAEVPERPRPPRDGSNDRIEHYTQARPDGTTVQITRNVETGEHTVAPADT